MDPLTEAEDDLTDIMLRLADRERAYQRDLRALTAPRGAYLVVLASAGNPDFGQDPDRSMPGVPRKRIRVATLAAARAACRLYIAHYELGGGNWIGGQVMNPTTKDAIAQVSYNGRVWCPGAYPTAEIDVAHADEVARIAACPCARAMRCLCAGHAAGASPSTPCDTRENYS